MRTIRPLDWIDRPGVGRVAVMKRRTALMWTGGVAVELALAALGPAAQAAGPGLPQPPPRRRSVPVNLGSKLRTLPAATKQVVIVHAPTAATTSATLETFTNVHGAWYPQFAPMAARIGSQGFSDHHLEAVPTTPTGMYAFGATMYGIQPDPGVRYAYHRIVTNDWWNENPASAAYNTFQHTATNPGGESEALWLQTTAYRYFAFIAYNVPAIPGAGSAIFLHVGTGGPTAGCVSLTEANLVKVMTWLDPARQPRIVLSPDAALSRY
jgi:L,D-peptidoglycan transpeptidase YkuD (ErfK/YbiS/YcfS/YnhG family)